MTTETHRIVVNLPEATAEEAGLVADIIGRVVSRQIPGTTTVVVDQPSNPQNRVIHMDPDALVQLPEGVLVPGARHDVIDGHTTVSLGDLARHVIDMADAREHVAELARIADQPAHAYVDSTTAPLPGKVEHGTNPTTQLLDDVRRLHLAHERGLITDDEANRSAAELLASAVQVIRTVSVDTLRVAAGNVFDTAMPAYVARWLEAYALMLERGHDVHDADAFDAAVIETTAVAAVASIHARRDA